MLWLPTVTGTSPISKVKLARTGELPREDVCSDSNASSEKVLQNGLRNDSGLGIQPSVCMPCPDSPVSPLAAEMSSTGTKFNLHGAFCCHEDWRHSHHCSYVNRTKVWNDLRHRGVNSLMYLWQTDRCANDYWGGAAFANHIRWIDNLGVNGSRLVTFS